MFRTGLVRTGLGFVATGSLLLLSGCHGQTNDVTTLTVLIESSPNNLDVRVGSDAQSERLGGLIFDALVKKDEHFNLQPWLATSWEQPDALTWIFHIRDGVHFQDGKPLTAEDVAWSIRSMYDGTLVTGKSGSFAKVASVDVKDPLTVVVHMKEQDESLLVNVSEGLFGVVERGTGRTAGLHPVGTGPFKFVSQMQDKEVLLARNTDCWSGAPKIEHVRFDVVPETITAALMMKKGVADLESNVITLDMAHTLSMVPTLKTESGPSSMVEYMNFNATDPILKDKRVRQAIAYALNRPLIMDSIWRGQATLASTLLPPGHWAAASADDILTYSYDVERAKHLLDEAGHPAKANGIRLQLTIKMSNDELKRQEVIAVQQQLRDVGIDLRIRASEFATFYADITKGAFQMYILRWIGSNEDPDIYRYMYSTASFPPKGSNRGHYSNRALDALLTQAASERDQAKRREIYLQVQKIVSDELPSVPLWYPNVVIVQSLRVQGWVPNQSGNYDSLRTASLQ